MFHTGVPGFQSRLPSWFQVPTNVAFCESKILIQVIGCLSDWIPGLVALVPAQSQPLRMFWEWANRCELCLCFANTPVKTKLRLNSAVSTCLSDNCIFTTRQKQFSCTPNIDNREIFYFPYFLPPGCGFLHFAFLHMRAMVHSISSLGTRGDQLGIWV